MLKKPFIPYSEKLRQSIQRRLQSNESPVSNNHKLEIFDEAPDFTLYNTDNSEISLHDLLETSNVVLLFFPLAFTDVCTNELCTIRDNMHKYNQLNAHVIGISVDSMFALNKFKEVKQYQFELLSDFNREVSRKYNVIYEDFPLFNMKGVTKRAAFVINRKGIIQYIDILDDPGKLPDFAAIEKALTRCNRNN